LIWIKGEGATYPSAIVTDARRPMDPRRQHLVHSSSSVRQRGWRNFATTPFAVWEAVSAARLSARSSFRRLRLVVVTIADFRSSLAGGGSTRAASLGVLGCTAPSSRNGGKAALTSAAALPPKLRRRLLFAVTTAGASIATAFRFRGGRL
jgi:hypothetical protein